MSTLKSSAGSATACAVALCLFGCGSTAVEVSRTFTPIDGDPLRALQVQSGAVTITGPAGYCIDSTATREDPGGTFVMLGDCNRLFRGAEDSPEVSAVLTALVSGSSDQNQLPSPAQLERFFRSDNGRAALSLDGNTGTVTILQTRVTGDVLLLLVQDDSVVRPEGLSNVSWRAVLTVNNRLVSLAATEHLEEPKPLPDLRVLLQDFVGEILDKNASGATPGE